MIDETFKWRKLIIDSLQEIQNEFKTNELVYNGVYYWPILKVRLFFTAYTSINVVKKKPVSKAYPTKSFFNRIIYFIETFWQYIDVCYFPKKKIKYLSSGFFAHRIFDEGKWLNRYFVNLKGNRLHFEYRAFKNQDIDLAQHSFEAERLLSFYNRFTSIQHPKLEEDKLFKSIVDAFNAKTKLSIDLKFANNYLASVLMWNNFWTKILKRTKPEEVRVLCYYDATMYGLCIAANNLSIPVIDMQHGGQGSLHSAYNFIGELPNGGYHTMPSGFSVWDKLSKIELENAKIVSHENILLEGNPWIEYNRNKIEHNSTHKTIDIIYTLQTKVPVPEFLYETIIETADQYKWVLKTHPRMLNSELDIIKERLKLQLENNSVVIDTESSLLKLLLNSTLHTSGFSGSIQEAGLIGIPTIITDDVGFQTYEKLIEQEPEKFFFASTKQQFSNHMKRFVN